MSSSPAWHLTTEPYWCKPVIGSTLARHLLETHMQLRTPFRRLLNTYSHIRLEIHLNGKPAICSNLLYGLATARQTSQWRPRIF